MKNCIVSLYCLLLLALLVLRFGPPAPAAPVCRPVRALARVYGIGADWPRVRFAVRLEVAAVLL